MKNKRGFTVQYRIRQDIEYAKTVEDKVSQNMLVAKVLGAVDFAVEFGFASSKN